MRPKLIAILIMAVLILVVLFQNLDKVTIKFLFWSPSMPLLALVVILLVVGFVMGRLTCALMRDLYRMRKRVAGDGLQYPRLIF